MVSIQSIEEADYAEWLGLWHGYLEFYKSMISENVTTHTFTQILDASSDVHGAIARDEEGTAVGIVHWLTHPATWTTSTYCYLEDLFVAPRGRGGGIGRALIEHVRDWAEAQGSTKVYWLTAESNATAQALYDRVATRSGMTQYQIPLG